VGVQQRFDFTVQNMVLYNMANSLTRWLRHKTGNCLGDYILSDYHVCRWCDVPRDTKTMAHCRLNL